MDTTCRYKGERLEAFCRSALEALAVSPEHSEIVANCLIGANYQGVDTHGIARLPTYLRRLAEGAINAKAVPEICHRRGAIAVVDGHHALGPVAAVAGMKEAMTLASQYGIGYVAVRNSNHFSYAAYYCELAAANGLIGLCSSGGEPTVAPWGGTQAFFTNSPLALAAPTSGTAVVVDLATSVTSRGNIMLAKTLKQQIPIDWAIDKAGQPTADPAKALEGSVLPMGGAKGYALIVALEVLNSLLAGGAMAPDIGSQADKSGTPAGVPHFFLAIDPTAFMAYEHYLGRIDALVMALKSSPSIGEGIEIRVPGERRQAIAIDRRRNGIPLAPEIINELKIAADKYSPAVKEML